MFSTELSYTLEAAYREASQRKHAFFCIEHLLFALLFDEQVAEVIRKCGGNIERLREDLEGFFASGVEEIHDQPEPEQTPAVQRVLQRAILHMHSAGKKVITGRDVLVAIFGEEDSHAAFFLIKQHITREDVLDFISHGIAKVDDEMEVADGRDAEEGEDTDDSPKGQGASILARCTENLTDRARKGELDPIIGREAEIARAIQAGGRENSPVTCNCP
jgi:ATP-dependent Clp protease ATP-binding subunit ClpA